MDVDAAFWTCLLAGFAGFAIAALAETAILPKARLQRPWQSLCMHFALWIFSFSPLVCLTGRPFCSAAFSLSFIAILIFVNNAKFKSMREPFIFQDYDYFLTTIRFPRLFLPFLGLRSFCLCALGVLLAILALGLESAPAPRWNLHGQAGANLLLFVAGCAAFWLAKRFSPPLALSPCKDLKRLGFLPGMGFYGLECAKARRLPLPKHAWTPVNPDNFPHLVAIQSESFFDARQCWPEIHGEVYKNFDRFVRQAFLWGDLLVPAWGANTERSEFAFLTGIAPSSLGMARFNPYRILANGAGLPSLATHLRSLGYRAICVHPYLAAFYGRDKVFPKLGFNEFVDIKEFTRPERFGPYVSDSALAEMILEIQRAASTPTFIFAITMENHGPLHLEQPPGEMAQKTLFRELPPPGCSELGIYLRHARNTGLMLEKLRRAWDQRKVDVSLCFYGDHVPIMPNTWAALKAPAGHVPYFCWSNRCQADPSPELLACGQLAAAWLCGLKQCGRHPGRPDLRANFHAA